jgi:hypothetical protein
MNVLFSRLIRNQSFFEINVRKKEQCNIDLMIFWPFYTMKTGRKRCGLSKSVISKCITDRGCIEGRAAASLDTRGAVPTDKDKGGSHSIGRPAHHNFMRLNRFQF